MAELRLPCVAAHDPAPRTRPDQPKSNEELAESQWETVFRDYATRRISGRSHLLSEPRNGLVVVPRNASVIGSVTPDHFKEMRNAYAQSEGQKKRRRNAYAQ